MNLSELKISLYFFLRKTFDIREGEQKRVLLMQLIIFLIITTLLIVKPTVNSLFLTQFGVENLPFAFILVAIVAAGVSVIYSYLLRRIALKKLMIGTLWGSVISLIIFGVLLRANIAVGLTLYIFYIWVAIFALLTTSQFWVLANIVFNAREAKRLFGFIGAGAIVGGIFGGYLTSILAQIISSEFLPLICALFLLICIPLARAIWETEVDPSLLEIKRTKRRASKVPNPVSIIRQSKHLSYIAIIVGLSVMVAKLVDFQFAGIASSLIADPDGLTAFFGFWFSTFNVISLLLQLFVTRRIVGMYGVGSSLFFLPISILIAVVILIIFPELLLAAVFLKMADGGLKQSVNKAAMELLILPIPLQIKSQTKTFIDVFVDSLATGLSGLLLIFVVRRFDLSTGSINIIILILLVIWMYLASKVKAEYFKTFKQKLDFEKDIKGKPVDISSDSIIKGMQRILATGNERQIIFVLNKIKEKPDLRFKESIQPLLNNESAEIRVAAINILYFLGGPLLLPQILPLMADSNQKVKIAVCNYILAHGQAEGEKLIKKYLEGDQLSNRLAALVSLSIETQNNPRLRINFGFEQKLEEVIDQANIQYSGDDKILSSIELAKAIGHSRIPKFYPVLRSMIASDNVHVSQQAILSAGQTADPSLLDDIIGTLGVDALKKSAVQSLRIFGPGIIDVLKTLSNNSTTRLEIVRSIPSVVKEIGVQKSVDFLFELLDYHDLMVRQEALRGLNLLRNRFPELVFKKKNIVNRILKEAMFYQETLSVSYAQANILPIGHEDQSPDAAHRSKILEARTALIRLLEKRLDRNLERIFRLLGLNYPSGHIVSIYRGINSPTEDLRLNALEFLDNLLEPGLKKTIIPIIESSMMESITEEAIQSLNLTIPNEYDCFNNLLNGPDLKLKQSVVYLIGELGNTVYLPLLESYKINCPKQLVKMLDEAIQKLQAGPK